MDRFALPVRAPLRPAARAALAALVLVLVATRAAAAAPPAAAASPASAPAATAPAAAGPAAAAAPTPGGIDDAPRIVIYKDFRSFFDAGNYAAALPLAEKLVAATETQYGSESRELVNPLANLGTVQYRLGNHAAAEAAYLRSIKVIEGRLPGADRALLRPLQGLGETYLASSQPAAAAAALKRAVEISRNLDGLFNPDQLDLLDGLIEAHIALNQLPDAEKESQYAFRVAESSFGRSDLRMLEPLDRLGRWYEFVGRYTTARGFHARALQICETAAPEQKVRRVPALRGLARTYYLEFLFGPEESDTTAHPDPFDQMSMLQPPRDTGHLNAEGERALRFALEILSKAEPVDRKARGDTLVELGDWYLIAGSLPKANEAWRTGWQDLNAAGGDAAALLRAPRRLAYRPSPSSTLRARPDDPENFDERFVEIRLDVQKDGKVQNVATAATDAPSAIERQVVGAVKRARYAPRIEDGQAVDTVGVTFREQVLVKKSATPAAAPAKPAASPGPATP